MNELEIKIKLLEEIVTEENRKHGVLKECFDALEGQHIFQRDGDQALLGAMHECLVVRTAINRFLFPLYHERDRINKLV